MEFLQSHLNTRADPISIYWADRRGGWREFMIEKKLLNMSWAISSKFMNKNCFMWAEKVGSQCDRIMIFGQSLTNFGQSVTGEIGFLSHRKSLYKKKKPNTDTSIRRTLCHDPMDDSKTPLQDGRSRLKEKKVKLHSLEYWSKFFNELQSVFEILCTDALKIIRDADTGCVNK